MLMQLCKTAHGDASVNPLIPVRFESKTRIRRAPPIKLFEDNMQDLVYLDLLPGKTHYCRSIHPNSKAEPTCAHNTDTYEDMCKFIQTNNHITRLRRR